MTDIKHTLQRDLFTPNDERLLGVVLVGKPAGKKKKTAFLCASVTTTSSTFQDAPQRPVEVTICKIKKQEKSDVYKKQKVWRLKEFKGVDGKNATKETTDFDLMMEKNYKWSASSIGEKNNFISCLWKLCHRYLPRTQKPFFRNVPSILLEVSVATDNSRLTSAGPEEDAIEDYQALTEQEEIDIEKMMNECEFAISDAEAFAATLSKDLNVLDGQNIHSIMGSEMQVNSLMRLLDQSLSEVSKIESRLDEYDHMMAAISTQMGQMKNQESFIQITNKNHDRLLKELDVIVMQLDLSKGHIKALREGDLRTDSGIEACTSAAEALQQAMEVELPKGLSQLHAVSEQQKLFVGLRQNFAVRLHDYLQTVFVKQGNEYSDSTLSSQMKSEYAKSSHKLPKHFPFHRDLLPYRHLVMWLKVADKTKFTQLSTVYTKNLNKLYSREIQQYMTSIKQSFLDQGQKNGSLKRSKGLSSSIRSLSGSQQSLNKDKKKFFGSTQSLAMKTKSGLSKKLKLPKLKKGLGSSRDSLASSEFELCDREKFGGVFREVLSELEPTCQDEEIFMTKFFHLNEDNVDAMMPGGSDDEMDDSPEGMELRKKYQENQVQKEKRRLMTEIFSVVESELSQLVDFGEELDPLNSLNMLVVIGQKVTRAQQLSDDSFLTKMLGNCLIQVKRNFDNFVKKKTRFIEESHLKKGEKCGVLSFVFDFEEFVELAESIFRDCERRTDIDKAYKILIKSVFDSVERVAAESYKTPSEVVKFENYHHLLNCLSCVKVAALEGEKKDVKARYTRNLNSYVTSMLGRPLEKLSNFFEGVQQVMDSGVRAEDVGFQLKFNKQELRKCVKEYSGKDVKKGLELLYHKINKHTAENDNRLLQVVWQHMQEEFLSQYKHFEQLITKCYPGSDIKLEFTIENVLQYFSDIAYNQ